MSPFTKSQKTLISEWITRQRKVNKEILDSYHKLKNQHQYKHKKEWAEGYIKKLEIELADFDEIEKIINEKGPMLDIVGTFPGDK